MSPEKGSPINNPRAFARYMYTILEEPAVPGRPTTYDHLVSQSKELEGHFRGNLAEQVAQWQEEGLGRMVRIPQVVRNVFEKIDEQKYFQDFLYALPYTHIPARPIDRALLIFSNYNDNALCVVKARTSNSPYEPEYRRHNEMYLAQFNTLFAPDLKPSYQNDWRLVRGENPITTFRKRPGDFAAQVLEVVDLPRRREVLQEAEASARRFRYKA